MKSIIKEYDHSDKLIYISDYYTGKGYRTKESIDKGSSEERHIEKYIESLRSQKKKQSNYFGDWINRTLNFNHAANDKKLFKILISLYLLLLLFLILIFSMNEEILKLIFSTPNNYRTYEFGIGILFFFIGIIFIHEFSHILIARVSNILVLKLGFKFKYYIFPIFYVKAMPTSYRMKKVNIAFVGLVSDLILVNLYFVLYMLNDNTIIFLIALKFQILLLLFNYNILLPTDFTQALLNYIDRGDFRKNVFIEVKRIAFNKQDKSNRFKKISTYIYILYSVFFLLFWMYILFSILYTLINTFF